MVMHITCQRPGAAGSATRASSPTLSPVSRRDGRTQEESDELADEAVTTFLLRYGTRDAHD